MRELHQQTIHFEAVDQTHRSNSSDNCSIEGRIVANCFCCCCCCCYHWRRFSCWTLKGQLGVLQSPGIDFHGCLRVKGFLMVECLRAFYDGFEKGLKIQISRFLNLEKYFCSRIFLKPREISTQRSNLTVHKDESFFLCTTFSLDTPSSQNKILPRREKSRDESKSWIFTITVCKYMCGRDFPRLFFSGVVRGSVLCLEWENFLDKISFFSPNYASCQSVATYAHHVKIPDDILLSFCTIMLCYILRASAKINAKLVCDLFHVFGYFFLSKHQKQTTFFLLKFLMFIVQ